MLNYITLIPEMNLKEAKMITIGNRIKFDNVIGHNIEYISSRVIEAFPEMCRYSKVIESSIQIPKRVEYILRSGIYLTERFEYVPPGIDMTFEHFQSHKFIQLR